MAIYPSELFTSSVRSTAASFIFNATRLIAWMFPIAAGTMIQFFGGIFRTAVTRYSGSGLPRVSGRNHGAIKPTT